MNLLFLDFETFYDSDYSLKKMTPPEYILDPRFEMIMCSTMWAGREPNILEEDNLKTFLQRIVDPATTITVSHNALFDSCILAWRYGFVPKMMLDTLGMSRALLGHKLRSHSLEVVAEHLGLGKKGDTLPKLKGMHAADIKAAGLWDEAAEYCNQDTVLCSEIFNRLKPDFPPEEMRVMDLVIRCTVEPRFVVDVPMLEQHVKDLRKNKLALLVKCKLVTEDDWCEVNGGDVVTDDQIKEMIQRASKTLMSQPKFVEALKDLDVEIETKLSPTTGEQIPALGKTDPFMVSLLENEDERVQALASARLGLKSTLEETRAEKMLRIAALPWPTEKSLPIPLRYSLPIPLRYAGAHTHRFSGDWGMNMQNLPRATTGGSRLRKAIRAPEGHSVVVCDLGQIEARLVAWQAGCTTLLTQFRDKLDPYARLAESIFGYPVDRKVQIAEGFVGKQGILGLGYMLGANNFYLKTKAAARGQGIDLGKLFTPELAKKTVDTYRADYLEIPELWSALGTALRSAFVGKSASTTVVGPVTIGYGYVELPNKLLLRYEDPTHNGGETTYLHPDGYRKKIYGGAMLENITQALARVLVSNALLRLDKLDYQFKWQVHDELVFVVPDADVDNAKRLIHTEMVRIPSWAPDLPLSADVGSGKSYGDAK